MKKVVMMFVLFLCAMVQLKAQTSVPLTKEVVYNRKDAGFYMSGAKLSDAEIRQLFGESIYYDTYLGAQKQYNISKPLIKYGAIATGAGALLDIVGGIIMWTASEEAGVALMGVGSSVLFIGSDVLGTGIAFRCISNGRLSWVEGEMNKSRLQPSLSFGVCNSGVGIALNF